MKKIVTPINIKDENGIYVKDLPFKVEAEPVVDDISIEELLGKGLLALSRLMKNLLSEITAGTFDRDTIMNLKDAMSMLKDLRKEEKELLSSLSDEELKKIADTSSK